MLWKRALGLLALSAATVVLAGPYVAVADEPKTAAEKKKEMRKKLKEELLKKETDAAKKPAEPAKAPETAQPAPPKKPIGPAHSTSEIAKLIDQSIDQKITEAKSSASAPCTDAEFLRRVYLDITGVIPNVEQARTFLDSKDPEKRAKLVDQLLASPNYGRHMADIWQVKLFPKDSNNRFVQRDPLVKWLEDQFNKNTPWNDFVTSLVTASGSVDEHPEVSFYLANRSVDKITDTVTQYFLGIQLQCAQCHNHPFTSWKQTEYWGVAAFFAKVNAQNPKNPNKGGDNSKLGVQEGTTASKVKDFFPESTKKVAAKFLGGPEPKLNEREPYRPALASWMVSDQNPYFAKAAVNRTWAMLFGRGFVDPVDDMHEGNAPSHPELLESLAREFTASGYDVKKLIRSICASQAYQRSSKPTSQGSEQGAELFARMGVKVLTPEMLFDSLAQVTGFGGAAANKKPAVAEAGMKRNANGPRDQFVSFFLAGADMAHPTEYESGIPQALRLMNSRILGNAGSLKTIVTPGAKPPAVIEAIYLACLSRRPTDAELAKLTDYVAKSSTPQEALSDIYWAVLNSSEFVMVR